MDACDVHLYVRVFCVLGIYSHPHIPTPMPSLGLAIEPKALAMGVLGRHFTVLFPFMSLSKPMVCYLLFILIQQKGKVVRKINIGH